mmetsp:Transcript_3853/g.7973  ORF Transcript_3853/g.7973 Transcript_3853/m.7973 type:complete len:288 (-) Transcript_3853:182-1045(-)
MATPGVRRQNHHRRFNRGDVARHRQIPIPCGRNSRRERCLGRTRRRRGKRFTPRRDTSRPNLQLPRREGPPPQRPHHAPRRHHLLRRHEAAGPRARIRLHARRPRPRRVAPVPRPPPPVDPRRNRRQRHRVEKGLPFPLVGIRHSAADAVEGRGLGEPPFGLGHFDEGSVGEASGRGCHRGEVFWGGGKSDGGRVVGIRRVRGIGQFRVDSSDSRSLRRERGGYHGGVSRGGEGVVEEIHVYFGRAVFGGGDKGVIERAWTSEAPCQKGNCKRLSSSNDNERADRQR